MLRECVLDTSALVLALTGTTTHSSELRRVLRATHCHAPHLIDAELGHVLRRLTHGGQISALVARALMSAAHTVVSERYPHGPLCDAAWRLRDNLTFYDALYVVLAARLRVPLLTADEKFASAPGLPCAIERVDQLR